MRTHVEFRSGKFPSLQTAEEGPNYLAGVYGKKLAEYLKDKLSLKGLQAGSVWAEDWGWCVEIRHEGSYPLFIGCGHYEEFEDGFLCFIEPSKPYLRKWFKKIDVRDTVGKVAAAMDAVLQEDTDIHSVRWWSAEEAA